MDIALLHGTTRSRAERILHYGPDPEFCEPHTSEPARSFSATVAEGPFLFGKPEEYALLKASAFPEEGGPVIVALKVPLAIILRAVDEAFPISQGLVQFDSGAGLEELIAAWTKLDVSIQTLSGEAMS